jgi:hypothetical protein
METLQLQVPPALQPFLAQRAAEHGHGDASEYVLSLIRADQAEHERLAALFANSENRARFERLLDEGLADASQPLDLDVIRREVLDRRAGFKDR